MSSWKQFQSYLQGYKINASYPIDIRSLISYIPIDMGHLTVTLGLGRTADDMLIIGECTVPNLVSLTPDKIERRYFVCFLFIYDSLVV